MEQKEYYLAKKYDPIVAAIYRKNKPEEKNQKALDFMGEWENVCRNLLGNRRYMRSRKRFESLANEIRKEMELEEYYED